MLLWPPEIFTFVGINVLVVLSLTANHYSNGNRPKRLPSVYQLIALIGLSQMYITNFVIQTSVEVRNTLSIVYFIVAMASVMLTMLVVRERRGQIVETSPKETKEKEKPRNGFVAADLAEKVPSLPVAEKAPSEKAPRKKTSRKRASGSHKEVVHPSDDIVAYARQLLEEV